MNEHRRRHRLSLAAAILIALFVVFLLVAAVVIGLLTYEILFTAEGWP